MFRVGDGKTGESAIPDHPSVAVVTTSDLDYRAPHKARINILIKLSALLLPILARKKWAKNSNEKNVN